jgi:hypothetical protein
MNWWYYFKKRFSIYPGVRVAVCAPFLRPYYERRRLERSWARTLLDAAIFVLFQLWVPVRAHFVARRFGFGRAWVRQATAIGRRRVADPNDIAVFRIAKQEDLDRYMRRYEYAEISKRTNAAAWTRNCVLADKALFAQRCALHDLPHPHLLARLRTVRVEVHDAPRAPGLAIKPTAGISGTGVSLVAFAQWQDGRVAFETYLRNWLGTRGGDWIVQSAVQGHPELLDVSLDALSTARITTMRNEQGEPEIVTAVLRFAGNMGAVVDNLAAGGLLAPIDQRSGVLGPACYGRRPEDVTAHPVTGAVIEGRRVPDWSATRDLVVGAHRCAFAEYSMIGWDVGVSRDGPILIEGNGKPGLFAAQRAERHGVGETRFGELLAYHLDLAAAGRLAEYLSAARAFR